MSFSRSSSATTSSQETNNQQVQAGGENSVAVGAGGTFIQTDHGAIQAAADVAQSALSENSDVARAGLATAVTLAGTNADVVSMALQQGEKGFATYAEALSAQAAAHAAADSLARQSEIKLADALTGEVVQANQPADVTVTNAATNTVKYVIAGLAVVALAVALLLRKKSAS